MKKSVTKIIKKSTAKKESEIQVLTKLVLNGFSKIDKKLEKNENDIDVLARIVSGGFERLQKEMDERFDNVDKSFKKVDERFFDLENKMNHKFEIVDSQLSSLHGEQRETNKRLDVIEKKQSGVLASVDEAIHRSEFKSLVYRVGVLEKMVPKKTTKKS